MTTVNDILSFLNEIAPLDLQEEWDNSGLLIGNENNTVNNVLLALDITNDVICEAVNKNCNLIVTHHPVIFDPIKKIVTSSVLGKRLYNLLQHDISVISMHTNLDKSILNKLLLDKIGCVKVDEEYDYLHTGYLAEPISVSNLVDNLKINLNNDGIRYYDSSSLCRKVGCVSGSGGNFIKDAINCGCDTFVTGDIKHQTWLDAKDYGINLIDAEHFNTENIVIPYLSSVLQEKFSEISFSVSETNTQVIIHG